MKHFFTAILAALAVAACGGGDGTVSHQTSTPAVARIASVATAPFQQAQPLSLPAPWWNSNTMVDEPILPSVGRDTYQMWRGIGSITQVRDRNTGTVYSQGTDYTLTTDGNLYIPPSSTIPRVSADFIHTVEPNTPAIYQPWDKQGNPLRIYADFQQHQIAVSYVANTDAAARPYTWPLPYNFRHKLQTGQPVYVTFVGDSITVGGDSTKLLGIAPQQPAYAELVMGWIASQYPGQVFYRNRAVAGTVSANGAADAANLVGDTYSDLIVIAYGMNDATGPVSRSAFEANLQTIINAARSTNANPNADVLLVSSWPGNGNWAPLYWGAFVDYYGAMTELAGTMNGVFVANVTSTTWDSILARKHFEDITSNGVNHPNDWMHTVYATLVLASLMGF